MPTPPGRQLEKGRYGFDGLQTGDWLRTGELCLEAGLIDLFADLTGDRFEIHMSDAAAHRHGFPRRVAHGLLVLSLIDGLKNRAEARFNAVASLGWTWSFNRPVLIGDSIHGVLVVREKRLTRKGDRGIVKIHFEVCNQQDEVVQSGFNQLMVYC